MIRYTIANVRQYGIESTYNDVTIDEAREIYRMLDRTQRRIGHTVGPTHQTFEWSNLPADWQGDPSVGTYFRLTVPNESPVVRRARLAGLID